MNKIIEAENLSKIFGDTVALNNISFDVKQGQIFGFLGPSGAGKTTTIKLLTSQHKPTNGKCFLFEKEIMNVDQYMFHRIGVLSDTSSLYERMTVEENLMVFAKFYNVDIVNIDGVLESVKLLNHKKKVVNKLSKGMKQRCYF